MIICIGREFGSGGHDVGKCLASNLKIPYYDRKLIDAAEDIGLNRSVLEKADEAKANPWLDAPQYKISEVRFRGLSANDIVYQLQSEWIYETAVNGPCVIVGRCADFVPEQTGVPHLSIFITAPLDARVSRVMERDRLSEKDALATVKRMDKQRKAYYNYYTDRTWGDPHNYDLCINSATFGVEKTAGLLTDFIRNISDQLQK